ncbi:MAG: PilZ domain-containing protein [Nitrospira sp.]|nr:PilZ domain-containing protein [Nitrospira sp.]
METIRRSSPQATTSAQLRRHPRVRVLAPFPCSLALVGLKQWRAFDEGGLGVVYDVSAKGARVMTQALISPGDRVAINLRLPNQAASTVIELATVRWGKEQTYGIEFQGVSSSADTRLQTFMDRLSMPSVGPTP